MFYKVSSTVKACNDVRRKAGQEPLPYAWMEVEFGDNLTVAQATEAGSAFPSDALSVVEKARDLACAGVLRRKRRAAFGAVSRLVGGSAGSGVGGGADRGRQSCGWSVRVRRRSCGGCRIC